MKNALLLLSLLVPSLAAQVAVTVPNAPVVNVDRPFAGGIGRYQQWYSAASLQAGLPEPVRLTQIEFFAGTSLSSTAAMIDCEFLLGYGQFSGVFGTFDNNFVPGTQVTVKPRAMVQLSAGASGAVVMTVPFTNNFTWDRQRPLLLEIRVYGNSLGSQPFNYNFRGTTVGGGSVARVYGGGGGGLVSTGTVVAGTGMTTRFTARPGVTLTYGTGCPGEGNIVPTASVSGLAWPGITWTHQLQNAASQRLCIWSFGDSQTDLGGAPLAIDLTELFGLGSSGCLLRNNAVFLAGLTTVGGGAGSGFASLPVQLPAVTNYVGLSVFSQWVVFDPLAPSGVLSTTAGIWTIVAPVGG